MLFASSLLDKRSVWLDKAEDPLDEVTDADWDIIETLVSNLYEQLMTPEIGAIFAYMTASPPENCLICDGATYARTDYPTLYSLLDVAFVLDADTFFVPDLRSRIPVGAGTGAGLSTYAVNAAGGEENHFLTVAEMPSHQHSLPQELPLIVLAGAIPISTPSALPLGGTGFSGGNLAHNNIQPFRALNYCVRAL